MSQILSGLPSMVCIIDDILDFGQSQQEHDQRLDSVLTRISKAGITLNSEKCEFSKNSVKFKGHVNDEVGIHPDPNNIQAILEIKAPTSVVELCRFLGMVTYLSKFSPNLSQKIKPLRDLLSTKNEWLWESVSKMLLLRLKKSLVALRL